MGRSVLSYDVRQLQTSEAYHRDLQASSKITSFELRRSLSCTHATPKTTKTDDDASGALSPSEVEGPGGGVANPPTTF